MIQRRKNDWENRLHYQNITNNADQVEMRALVDGNSPLKNGSMDERIAGALDDFDTEDNATQTHWVKEDIQLDNVDGSTAEEIQRRIDSLQNLYPFKLNGASLIYSPPENNTLLYEALLCISQAKNLTHGKYVYLPRQFEYLACIISEEYLGVDSLSFRTGWPRGPGEPKRLKELVKKLREITGDMIGEWSWHPREGLPDDPSHKNAKEYGVDVVAWKRNIDNRPGQLYLLGQCACGKDWIHDDKLAELNTKKLIGTWVDELPIPHCKAFFTPSHATDSFILHASRKSESIVFDRLRIVMYGDRNAKIRDLVVRSQIQKIIDIVSTDAK
jgi:hypothetical protein